MIPTLIRSPDASVLVAPALAVSVAALPVAALLPASEEPHATRLISLMILFYREKKQKTMKIPLGKVGIFMAKKNHPRKRLNILR